MRVPRMLRVLLAPTNFQCHSTMAEAMNVNAAAAGAAAGDEDLVHFLITNTGGKGLLSCRLTIPKNHLENLPSSYLSALSSRRWAGDDESPNGTVASPFIVSVEESPGTIREIWSKYSQGSALFIPLIQKAYESAAGGGAPMPIVLPPTVELEDGVNFLKYYGLFPIGHDNMVTVPKDGPVAVYLRAQLYPAEAFTVKIIKDALIKYLGDNPERVTFFVFAEDEDKIKRKNNNIHEGALVDFRREISDGRFNTDYVAGASIRDKLVQSLREDKLEADFMTKETPLVVPKLERAPKGEKEQQALLCVKTDHPSEDDYMSGGWNDEVEDDWYSRFYRVLGWRYVLRVSIPDV